jgi:hypothetical protein
LSFFGEGKAAVEADSAFTKFLKSRTEEFQKLLAIFLSSHEKKLEKVMAVLTTVKKVRC